MNYLTSQHSRLEHQYLAIIEIIEQITEDRINLGPNIGKWSVKDNVAHLVRYQYIFLERINKILQIHEPTIKRYKAEDDPEFESWRTKPIEDLLKHLREQRKYLYIQITDLSQKELLRKGFHPKYGRLSITQWVEFFLLHEAHHIFTIFKIANDVDLKK